MTQTALGVGECQGEGSGRRTRRVILLSQRFCRLTIRRHTGRKAESDGPARQQSDPLTQTHDRIEHDTRRARQRAPIERDRPIGAAPATEEARAIGFPLDGTLRPPLQAQCVKGP